MAEAEKGMDELAEKIDAAITNAEISDGSAGRNREEGTYQPKLVEIAERIFHGIDDIHSEDGLKEVVSRYADSLSEMDGPKPHLQ
jgi:hypothetical protein